MVNNSDNSDNNDIPEVTIDATLYELFQKQRSLQGTKKELISELNTKIRTVKKVIDQKLDEYESKQLVLEFDTKDRLENELRLELRKEERNMQ